VEALEKDMDPREELGFLILARAIECLQLIAEAHTKK
jgi:hypothetical protein